MKRIVVIMALLSSFLWCSTSVLAFDPMEGHYTVSTQVTALADGFYRYDLAVTNVDQGTQPGLPWVGLDVFFIQVPVTATLREIQNPAICPSDPLNDSNGGRYWGHGTINGPLYGYPWYGKMPENGYQWLGWWGQNTIYPQGTTAHFIFEVNAPPGSNLGLTATYLGTGIWTNYTYRILQGNVTGPVLGAPAAPVAKAGDNQTVHAGATVTLDGSASTDPGGNLPLTYAWKFTSMPDGSTAALDNPASKTPSFIADKYNAGNWVLELVVTNSKAVKSTPATVTISTSNSAPVAEAGPDQSIHQINNPVLLDGSQSYDPDGDTITYQWRLSSLPGGSTATLLDSKSKTPSFVPDVLGTYTVELVVNDSFAASAPDTVTISCKNLKPLANAGSNQSVVIGATVALNGSASSDPDGDPLTYKWKMASVPVGSSQEGFTASTVTAAFKPDVPGDYVVQLIVNDGFQDSDASTVSIHVASSRSGVTEKLRNVIDDLGNKGLLPDDAFKNKNMRNTLINKLNVIIKDVDAGNYAAALAKLQEDIMAKTDGCAETVPPAPDNNDWIVTCTYQSIIYPELEEIAACITELAK